MIKYRLKKSSCINVKGMLEKWLKYYLDDGGFFREIDSADKKSYVFCADDFSLRINSTLSMMLVVEESANGCFADVVVSGGASGLLRIGHGAEKSRAKMLIEMLTENGFVFTD